MLGKEDSRSMSSLYLYSYWTGDPDFCFSVAILSFVYLSPSLSDCSMYFEEDNSSLAALDVRPDCRIGSLSSGLLCRDCSIGDSRRYIGSSCLSGDCGIGAALVKVCVSIS